MTTSSQVEKLKQRLRQTSTLQAVGKVTEACGTIIKVTGLAVRVGEVCRLHDPDSQWSLNAEVIGLSQQGALLVPMGHLRNLSSNARVQALGHASHVRAGKALKGRVVDANGLAIDKLGALNCESKVPLYSESPDPMTRNPICRTLGSGIKVIDSLLSIGEGQRVGIFAAAGGGKSTLQAMLARNSDADINVIALIGERGREVRDFIEQNLDQSLERSVVVVATSDQPPLLKARALNTATAIAEYFRDQGCRVQLLVDSITRYARALRDVGLAAGEPPTRQGYPPSVFSTLSQILERTGNNEHGSITAFYTVLVEDETQSDPIAEEVRSILDGHIILSRQLAAQNHYPAIDVLKSTSRLMNHLVSEEHSVAAAKARQLLAKYNEIELLIQMGEYQRGNDKQADHAVLTKPKLDMHLQQATGESYPLDNSIQSLIQAIQS